MSDMQLKVTLVYLLIELDNDGDVTKEASYRKKFTDVETRNLAQLTMDDLIDKFTKS